MLVALASKRCGEHLNLKPSWHTSKMSEQREDVALPSNKGLDVEECEELLQSGEADAALLSAHQLNKHAPPSWTFAIRAARVAIFAVGFKINGFGLLFRRDFLERQPDAMRTVKDFFRYLGYYSGLLKGRGYKDMRQSEKSTLAVLARYLEQQEEECARCLSNFQFEVLYYPEWKACLLQDTWW